MNLEDTIEEALWNYPTLFYGKFAREQVLDHLFFTLGNGYEWRNGQLISLYPEKRISQEEHDEKVKQSIKSQHLWKSIPIFRDEKKILDLPQFYPIYDKGGPFNIPEDVRQDFLLGVLEILNFAIDYGYKCFLVMDPGLSPEKNKEMAKKSLKNALKAKEWILNKFSERLEK